MVFAADWRAFSQANGTDRTFVEDASNGENSAIVEISGSPDSLQHDSEIHTSLFEIKIDHPKTTQV
ncbi:hypothetical protein N7523_000252 [Penicillium sp. IBT 18751x]|nr:hypothetical protein N7523_000252 [Penicillium sp. IBT 18751x]